MHSPERYSITTRLVEVDGDKFYEASVRELPDLRVYEETASEAYAAALEAIAAAAALADELGKDFPAPAGDADEDEASGRITLRLPRQLHSRMARLAADDEVSLNVFIVAALSNFDGFRAGHRAATREMGAKLVRNLVSDYYDVSSFHSYSRHLTRWETDAPEHVEITPMPWMRSTLHG